MSLRETKKCRTREQLVDTALTLFSEHGVSAVTIDELCTHVEISKRTFFRYFPGKDAVVLAPLADMWKAFLDTIPTRPAEGRALAQVLTDALDDSLTRMPEDWARQAVVCLRLIDREQSLEASARTLCLRTTRTATEALSTLTGDSDSASHKESALAADLVSAAFAAVQREWVLHEDGASVALLRDLIRAVPRRLKSALTKQP